MDVAVDAGVVGVLPGDDGLLGEGTEVALAYLHAVPDFVARFDQAVGEVAVYAVAADLDGPVSEEAAADAYAAGLFELLPLCGGDADFASADCVAVVSGGEYCRGLAGAASAIVEVQRGNVAGDCDASVVREHRRLSGRFFGAGAYGRCKEYQKGELIFHS